MTKKSKSKERREAMVEINYKAFKKALPDLMEKHAGKYALMHNAKVQGVFTDVSDVSQAGELAFGSDFSLQEIRTEPRCFGWYSFIEPLG